jgi:predicted nucleic acid-binding protein
VGVRTGLDTGVFVLLAGGQDDARGLWEQALSGKRDAVVSALTLFELDRLGLRGAIPPGYAETALESIPRVCEVIWLDRPQVLRSGARLSHGLGLSLADSLILASLVEGQCKQIFTTDGELLRYKDKDVRVTRLSSP